MTRWTTLFAGGVAVLTIVAGIVRGVPVAGGADSSGYVNQGRLWAAGRLHVDVPVARELSDLLPFEAFAPLGFRTSVDGRQLVPVYPPGLPMAMGLGERLGGHRAAFLVVPLLGGLAVWATFLMGRRVADHPTGLIAGILLATSPAFATALMFPESDVAVTAWWTLSLALLARPGASAAVASGLSAGAAVLTRLNLVPLALVPAAWLLWHALRGRTRLSFLRAAGFAAGLMPACLTAAWLNARLYGSPLRSGYGSLEGFFAWSHFRPNLERYPAWILDALTPIVLLGAVAPFALTRLRRDGDGPGIDRSTLWMWIAFVAGVLACYMWYLPWDDPGFIRFLLPAFPPLAVLVATAVRGLTVRLPTLLRVGVPLVLVTVIAARGVQMFVRQNAVHRQVESRYAYVGEFAASRLPARTVLLAMQHSGSAAYYTSRPLVRYDLIPPESLDAVVARLESADHPVYILLDEGEEAVFRARFSQHTPRGFLDWAPEAQLVVPRVNLYALSMAHVNGDTIAATHWIE